MADIRKILEGYSPNGKIADGSLSLSLATCSAARNKAEEPKVE